MQKKGLELIDMRKHSGEHARMGAVDVVPFIPIGNCNMKDCVLCERFGKYLGEIEHTRIPLCKCCRTNERKLLPNIRKGEYEGFNEKIKHDEWKPDFGPQEFIAKSGVTASGARSVFSAFNINLDTDDKSLANSIAGKIRTSGVLKKDKEGNKILDVNEKTRKNSKKENLVIFKAAGWMYDQTTAQVSMNLLNFQKQECMTSWRGKEATKLNLKVTAGELVWISTSKCNIRFWKILSLKSI